jgi:thioredoxin 1
MSLEWKKSKPEGQRLIRRPRFAACHLVIAWLAGFALVCGGAEPAALKPSFHATLKSASEAAAADQSLVLLVFSAEWCGPCKELKRQTISSPEFLEQGGALHLAEVDIDADQKMASDFAVEAVPTLVLLTADGKIVARRIGFMHTAELLPWLEEGRRRAKAGQWEGTAPGAKFDEFARKAATDSLTTNDLQRLVELLGETDPTDRAGAARILFSQREQAIPPLIDAVGHPYLGVRIAASELLQRLASDNTISIDPWQSPAELGGTVAALKKWWAETGKLPLPATTPAADPSVESSIKAALDELRGDDPVKRTEAMAALVGHGAAALPAVREAIRRAERTGDQHTLVLLEDVRWAILVSDAVEERTGGVRYALARGKSSDRQLAAERLGRTGRDVLGALTELVNDSDPLVVESAVRALSGVGGKDAIPAMAALLQAADSNLRMTAAQALGHTKNAEAIKPLLTVLDDPNEVVACTALAALEEVRSRDSYSSSRESLPGEMTAGLRHCLGDSRWRVRAAAAEVIGKLNAGDLADDLKKLLEDTDGFVVKNALAALSQLQAAPDAGQLAALGKRMPSLRGETVAMMLMSETDETAKTVTEIFNASGVSEQLAVLNAMARQETSGERKSSDAWKPLFTRATTATDPRLRHAAAEVLAKASPNLAAELVGPLLADEDPSTRIAAANVVLGILAGKSDSYPDMRFSSSTKTNKTPVTAGQIATWHTAMLQRSEPAPDLAIAAAVFATGDGKADLPLLLASLKKLDPKAAKQRENSAAIAMILSRLSWPEGQPLLDQLCRSPLLFAMAAKGSTRAAPGVADYLLEPSRFKSAVEQAGGEESLAALEVLAGYNYGERRVWSLWSESDRIRAIALALVESTNAPWRAAAVFSLGLRDDADKTPAVFEKALADSNAWVRAAAVQSLARHSTDRTALEARLGPLLADTNLHVAATAASALLEPEVRQAAELGEMLDNFKFETVYGGRDSTSTTSDERPLTTLEAKPAFLQQARDWMMATNTEESVVFALLLAQYGQFDGVERLIARGVEADPKNELVFVNGLLTGIALSRDVKYIPALRKMAAARHDEWELRKILQALKGMTGPDARQLRLEINKQLRNAGSLARPPDD